MAIKACKARGKYVGICGQGPSDHPDFATRKKNQDRVKITAAATFIAVIVGFIIHPLLVILPILCSFISPCIAWSTIIHPEMETFLKKCNDDILKNTNVTIVFCARGNNYLNTSDHTDYSFLLIESTPL